MKSKPVTRIALLKNNKETNKKEEIKNFLEGEPLAGCVLPIVCVPCVFFTFPLARVFTPTLMS